MLPALVALFVLCLFILKVLSTHGWDPHALILERPKDLPAGQKWGVGYDGRFSYALATQPWGSVQELDQPGYRYQRILYPLLVRGLSFGQPEVVPWAMLVVNLAAAAMGCAALGDLLNRRGISPWVALVFVFSLGYLLVIRLDLLEPLALALALCGWLAYERDRRLLAVVLFALSGLTKEVGLLFPAGILVWEALKRNWVRSAVVGLGSLSPYLIWFGALYLWFGSSPTQAAQSSPVWVPFYGIRYLGNPISQGLTGLWVLGPALLAGLGSLWETVRWWVQRFYLRPGGDSRDTEERYRNTRGLDAILVQVQVALVAIMPAPSWEDPLAVLRVGLGLLAAILVWLASSHPRLLPYAAALWLPSGAVLFWVPGMM